MNSSMHLWSKISTQIHPFPNAGFRREPELITAFNFQLASVPPYINLPRFGDTTTARMDCLIEAIGLMHPPT
jgi:hypothetical protein